jgi:long-chain acyl-CoA synthetase
LFEINSALPSLAHDINPTEQTPLFCDTLHRQNTLGEFIVAKPWEVYYSAEAKRFDPAQLSEQTIPELARASVEKYGDRPALTTFLPSGAQTTITYRQLGAYSDHFAAYLREVLGLSQGDTVAVMSPNCIGFCVASLGIAKAGCIGTNINPLYTAAELEHQLSDSGATAIVIIDLFADKLDAAIGNTKVKHVITLSAVDFFPAVKKLLLGAVLKYVKKVIPTIKASHMSFADAMAKGQAAAQGLDVAAYTSDMNPSDTALYQYTSGTTGRSKGAELSHMGIRINAEQGRLMSHELMDENGETVLIVLPLYHITAFTLIFISGLATGIHGVLVPSPRPLSNLRKAFETYRVTWFTGINTLYAALLTEPWFERKLFDGIRFCGSGGAAQQTGVAKKWTERTGIEICQGYGMTEICGVLTLNPPSDNRLGTVGIPVPGAELRIVDDAGNDVALGQSGEVIARSPTLMKGYLNNPDATAEVLKNGWYHSGDIGVMDEQGFVEIVDRKKDMILVSGFNVSPNEIEDVISRLPGVEQVGVIGIPDDKTAEAPAAFIVRSDESLDEEAVISHCRDQLTNYKTPRLVRFVDEVPVTLSGKVLRRQLRDEYL